MAGVVFTGCFEDEDELVQAYDSAVVPMVTDVNPSFYNFSELDGSTVGFKIDIGAGNASVESMTVQKSYNGGAPQNVAEINTFPATIEIPIEDALAGLSVTKEDLALGDFFRFTILVHTTDGRTLTNAMNVDATVSCPSDLAGTYTSVSGGPIGPGSPAGGSYSDLAGEVIITADGGGVYSVDDLSAGLYELAWGAFGAAPQPGTFRDVCGEITIIEFSDQYGDTVTGTGKVNEDGTITYTWINTYGDGGTVVLTKK